MARRRIAEDEGRKAVQAVRDLLKAGKEPTSAELATAVRYLLEELATIVPGRSVEVRVPPYGAVQCVAGPTHTRGTPPDVIELDATTWVRLAIGDLSWADALGTDRVSVSGSRATLESILPIFHA